MADFGVNDTIVAFGGDDEILPIGNPAQANQILNDGLLFGATPQQSDAIDGVLSPQEMEFNTTKAYYDQKFGTNHTPEMVEAQIRYEYGDDATPQVANQMNRKAAKWGRAKTAGASGIEAIESLARAGQFFSEAFLSRNPLRKKPLEWRKDDPLGKRVTDAIVEAAPEAPETWTQARGIMRQKAAAPLDGNALEVAIGFLDKGGILLMDNLPNMAASAVNPTLGMTVMFANEKNASYEAMKSAGIADDISENMSSLYGMLSAPVEYAENVGRVTSAFGVNPKKSIMRAIAGKLKNAGTNVGEEAVQKFFDDLIYNDAVRLSNDRDGTDIPLRDLGEGYGEAAMGSLAMSVVLEALGIGAKGIRGVAGMTKGDAQRIRNQNSNKEIDTMVNDGILTPEEGEAARVPTEENVENANRAMFEAEEIAPLEIPVDEGFGALTDVEKRRFQELQQMDRPTPLETVELDELNRKMFPEQEIEVAKPETEEVSDFVGFSTEKINEARVERGEAELDEIEVKSHKESMERALDHGLNQTAESLAERILESEQRGKVQQMSDEEVAGMGARIVELRNERLQILRDHAEAIGAGDREAIDDAQLRLAQNHQRADMVEQAIKTSATAAGRANSMMASMVNRFTYDVASLVDSATIAKGEALTAEEISALQDSARKIEELELKIADLQEQIRTGEFKETKKRKRPNEPAEVTTLKGQLNALRRDARNKIYELRKKTARDWLKEIATLPRTMMATADMSYGLRQGLLPSFGHPKIASETWGKAFKAFFSQNTADEIDVSIREHPLHNEMIRLGLHFSSLDSAIEDRTEFFASNLAEKIPGFGKIVMASERNMVTGINLLRHGLMVDFLTKHPEASEKAKRAYARYINIATGRGQAKVLDRAAEELSLVFFAPRFAVSRIQAPYVAAANLQHPELRGEIVRQWGAMLGTGMAILAMAKLAGFDVGDDPEKADWGKIIIDDKIRIDMFGGIQQPLRVVAKSAKGAYQYRKEGETDVDMIADMANFLKYKLSPPIHMLSEFQSGKDIIGREIEPIDIGGVEMPKDATTFVGNITPLVLQSVVEAYNENLDPAMIAALAIGEGLGLSIQVYEE